MAGSSAAAAVDLTEGEPPVPAAPVDLTGDDTDVDEEPAAAPAAAAPAGPSHDMAMVKEMQAAGQLTTAAEANAVFLGTEAALAAAMPNSGFRPVAPEPKRQRLAVQRLDLAGGVLDDSILARVDAIAQQENCVGCDGRGLAEAVARKLPYGSSYSSRRRMPPQNKFAVPEDRGVPGTIVVCRPPAPGPGRPIVVNMMAQFEMGAPNKYKRVKPMPPDDGAATREAWFQQCLDKIAAIQPPLGSIAFPYQIGCGLAGGNWSRYDAMITRFAERCPATQVYICKLTGDGGPTGTGRGRGGGGGGRGRAGDRCFKCGQTGHWASHCPNR